MAERVTDLRDIRDRVIAELSDLPEPGGSSLTCRRCCAEDLAPADTAGLDHPFVALATKWAHQPHYIMPALGCPVWWLPTGWTRWGRRWSLSTAPEAPCRVTRPGGRIRAVAAAKLSLRRLDRSRRDGRRARRRGPRQRADGAAARVPARLGGVGVPHRLCFLNRDRVQRRRAGPDLRRGAEAFSGHKVVIRTLDAGSDKPLKFVGHPEEANPALGVRGIRIAEGNPGLLERQLEAIAAAAKNTGNAPWVMAPMIATADEAKRFAAQVRSHGLTPGVMIEVPAAALLADRILEHVDFLSIGTNDLAQYTMAADRMSADLALLTDPWQPAVLALVATAVRAGASAGKPVGVCGEAAADPLLACVLTGLGVTSLSAAAAAVNGVGAKLSQVTLQQCRDAADAVLATGSAADARAAALGVLG